MAADSQEFLLQGLTSLLGGLLGVSLGAWLAGLYKIKGEITGRAECEGRRFQPHISQIRIRGFLRDGQEVVLSRAISEELCGHSFSASAISWIQQGEHSKTGLRVSSGGTPRLAVQIHAAGV